MLFSDLANEYVMLDYKCSHSLLLLRSMPTPRRAHNIDIVFKGVENLFISERLKGIEIRLVDTLGDESPFLKRFGFRSDKDYRIFEILSLDRNCYVNALAFGVYHNQLDILESSIAKRDGSDLGQEVSWFPEPSNGVI